MKVKAGFMLREVAGNYVVVPIGQTSLKFNGLITLNSTGAFLWKSLKQDQSVGELVDLMINQYEIDHDTARKDIEAFINKIGSADLLE